MRFNSWEFALFLPLIFLVYWGVQWCCHRGGKAVRYQNICIVIASSIFYGWWDWRFLPLIYFTSLCSYFCGRSIEQHRGSGRDKVWHVTNIVVNLAILGLFKYFNFFAESFAALLQACHIQAHATTLRLVLPVGISFYTFQAISYTVDVYRGRLPASRDLMAFCSYIMFFPQLVAGPIERATHLLPQFQRRRSFSPAAATDGMRQMLWGFVKKLVVADNCAHVVNSYWDAWQTLPSNALVVLAVLFTLQIYADFSAYSDIAIGCARLFGIELRGNFRTPYFSRSIPEFWRRWHISLTAWLRDYVYIPLGGNRGSRNRTLRNILIVFLISGLWHGANWTFVAWGLYHGLLLCIANLMGHRHRPHHVAAYDRHLPTVKEVLQMGGTFCLVTLGWVLFRAESLPQTFGFIARIFTAPTRPWLPFGSKELLFGTVLLAAEWVQRRKAHGLKLSRTGCFRHGAVRWALYYMLVVAMALFAGASQTFIYFQF